MTRIIAIVNQKGGVAKTTTTINLGAGLAAQGKRVLLVDLDPQGSMTASLGINTYHIDTTVYELLTEKADIKKSIVDTEAGYQIITADIRLSGAEMQLINMAGREMILKEQLDTIQAQYDYILIDCPPSLGLLTLNALTAADEIYIPLQAEFLALLGMSQLMDTIKTVQQRLNSDVKVTGIIPTLYDKRKKLNKEVLDSVTHHFGNILFDTKIRNNISLAEAASYGEDIFRYKPNSNGAADYAALVKEVLEQEDKHDR